MKIRNRFNQNPNSSIQMIYMIFGKSFEYNEFIYLIAMIHYGIFQYSILYHFLAFLTIFSAEFMVPGPYGKTTGPCNDFMLSDKWISRDNISQDIKNYDYDDLAMIFPINLRINGAICFWNIWMKDILNQFSSGACAHDPCPDILYEFRAISNKILYMIPSSEWIYKYIE